MIGTEPNQVPTNADLGDMAYKDTVIVPVPASASAKGKAGEIAVDSSYVYICIATDTWKRVAIATW